MYTNVFQYGSKMLVRGYDSQGNQFKRREDFSPTIFVPSREPTDWKTLQGQYVAPLHPGTMRDTKEYIEKYKDVSGFEIYGNTNYVAQYVGEHWGSQIDFDASLITLLSLSTASFGIPAGPNAAKKEISS